MKPPDKYDKIIELITEWGEYYTDYTDKELAQKLRKHFPPVSKERIEEIADQWWKDHTDWLKDEFRTGHPKDIVKAALRKLAGKGGE